MATMHRAQRWFGRLLALWAIAAIAVIAAAPAVAAGSSPGLDNAGCLKCHGGQTDALEAVDAAGKTRALRPLKPDGFMGGVHARMACNDCHTKITDSPGPGKGHQRTDTPTASIGCADCHQALWDQAQKDGSATSKPRLGVVVDNIAAYRESFHARPNADDRSRPNASCDGCHDSHSFNIPKPTDPAHDAWRLTAPAMCGDKCHTEALETYTESVHGKELLEKRNAKAAMCSDCHTAHAVGNTSTPPIKLAITASCGNCHVENYKSYKATYHGKVSTLGYAHTAKCFDCHGSHGIQPAADPQSMVHADNRLETCRECHSGRKELALAPVGYASFQPHARTDDFERYPQVWLAFKMMVGLLLGTFAFFWAHSALWFYREFKDRQQGVPRPGVKIDAVAAHLGDKHVKRFSATWRVAHLTFALSLMILTLTGMPLFYPDAAWAPLVMQALGGPTVAGLIHRVCAVVFAGVFFWHIGYMALGIYRQRGSFAWFGPNSMVPNWQDLKDIVSMFKWFVGAGPRPQFDRWTYWEKFDYWAPFWGVTIIGVSGLVMWLANFFGGILPGWVFNVAAILHGEEAFLAVVFLFTVHFFNNHFRPDKFPLDIVMFTGTMSLEHFKREHALQYQRLVASGELDQHLVDAPSPPMTLGSKVLGFVLIASGLTLLTGVAIGFFSTV